MKKEYQKPQLTKVDLKVQQTVLADCKISGQPGPGDPNCAVTMVPCSSTGTGS